MAAPRPRHSEPDLWVAWERHRRSRELARRLGADLRELIARPPYLSRVAVLSARTALLLARRRPRLLFVQNPSQSLTALAAWLRPLLGYALVVDRHSNFKLRSRNSRRPTWRAFHGLSRMTVRSADLTIVTNEYLARIVAAWGGRPFVLPDALPRLAQAVPRELPERPAVLFVCSYGSDEPLREVLEAAQLARSRPRVHITGDQRKAPPGLVAAAPPNVTFTGYLEEAEYQSLLASCDAALALTTAPHTMLCAAYEAVAVGRPLILSNHEALRSYFTRGVVLTDNSAAGIARAIDTALERAPDLRREMAVLAQELETAWQERFAGLQARLGELRAGRRPRRTEEVPT